MKPDEFYDLFCLCLYWQWNENDLRSCWTTVDKVARVLNQMDMLKDKERRLLSKDRRVQHLFLRRSTLLSLSAILPPTGFSHNRGTFLDWDKRRDDLLATNSELIINVQLTSEVNRERMLRDYRIYMTQRGARRARDVEPAWAARIDKDRYAAKCEELSLGLTDEAIAAMIRHYRERVSRETEAA